VTRRSDPPPAASEPDENALAAQLDDYLLAVQRDDPTAAQAIAAGILAARPDLRSMLERLQQLDRLLPVELAGPDRDAAGRASASADGSGAAAAAATPESRRRSAGERPSDPAAASGPFASAAETDPTLHDPRSPAVRTTSGGNSSLFRTLPADFGGYQLEAEIGRGGMGIVYRARHKSLQAPVAIKMIRSSQWASDDEVRRFYQEARAAARLSHPHIIQVHDVGEHDGLHYLAMDLVEGTSLAALAASQSCPPDRAAELLAAVARAVHYLHSQGLVHRDLKPANILLDAAGTPYVTDFGLAKVLAADARQTSTGAILGTPCYMSPEQAWGHADEVTPLSDIYSLGAILYELLAGRPPFKEDNPLDVLLKVREAEPMPPTHWNRGTPRALEQVCLRCLEKLPGRRYPSALELAVDLERFRRGEPLAVPSASLLHRLQRWIRREPGLAARTAGLAIMAMIEQGYYSLANSSGRDHWAVMLVLLAWGLCSWFCQWLLNRDRSGLLPQRLWAAADAVLLTLAIQLAAEPRELLLIAYPLLIVASGFWLRVQLVTFMTVLSLLASLVVWLTASDVPWPAHYPVLIGGIIALVGLFVGYQVHRLRVLSEYLERR